MDSAQLLADIRSLREETRIDSITPDRVGKILEYLLQTSEAGDPGLFYQLITSDDSITAPADDNTFSSLRVLAEISKALAGCALEIFRGPDLLHHSLAPDAALLCHFSSVDSSAGG